LADSDALNFRIGYLEKVEQLVNDNKDAKHFVTALKKAYPGLPGENGLEALAQTLYK